MKKELAHVGEADAAGKRAMEVRARHSAAFVTADRSFCAASTMFLSAGLTSPPIYGSSAHNLD